MSARMDGTVTATTAGHTDRADRRQAHRVEAFSCGTLKTRYSCGERTGAGEAGGIIVCCPLGTWEEIIPSGETGSRTLHAEDARLTVGHAIAQRLGRMQGSDLVDCRGRETFRDRELTVGQRVGGFLQCAALAGGQMRVTGRSPAA